MTPEALLSYSLAVAPVLLALALVFAVLGVILLRNTYPRGVTYLGLGMFSVALWVGGAGGELLAGDSPLLVLVLTGVKYVGVCTIPPLFLLFVLRHAMDAPVSPRWQAALFLLPLVSLVLVWTNPFHELMFAHPPRAPAPGARPPWGPWFLAVHLPTLYGMMLAAWAVLGVEMVRGSTLRRAQAAVLFFGSAVPLVVNAVYVANPEIPDVQLTSLSFAVTAVVFGWGFFRFRLFRVNPLAMRAVFDAVGDAVVMVDQEGRVADANPAAHRILAAGSAGEIRGQPLARVLELAGLSPDLPVPGAPAETLARDGSHLEIEVREISADRGGQPRGSVLVMRDVTARRRIERAALENEALVRSVVERAPIGIVRLRPVRDEGDRIRDFTCVLANPTTHGYLARDGQELVGRTLTDVRPPHTPLFIDTFRGVMGTREARDFVVQVDSERDGETRWFRIDAVPVGDDVSVTFVDITAERVRQAAMETVANQDALTGLLNRRGLEDDARMLLQSALRDGREAGLLFMDLDRFKEVNDTFGHPAGDRILQTFATRLQDCVRAEDLVGRVGGDEFVVLLQEGGVRQVREVMDRIRTVGSRPYPVGERTVTTPPSVGSALLPRDGKTFEALLAVADRAMYRAKDRDPGDPNRTGG
ncbi:MAG: diguanylate cyclase [Longimicrobiales bacterium]